MQVTSYPIHLDENNSSPNIQVDPNFLILSITTAGGFITANILQDITVSEQNLIPISIQFVKSHEDLTVLRGNYLGTVTPEGSPMLHAFIVTE